MLESIEKFIQKTDMISAGDVIGVGFSGGSDSMALLHYLANNMQKLDIEVVAIHIDHGIRENSYIDADFAKEKARRSFEPARNPLFCPPAGRGADSRL